MAEITLDQLTGSLNADQKTFFDNHLKAVSDAAVTKFKTDDAEARKKAVPEKYEFKIADGSPLDPQGDVEKIAAYARKHGLSNEQAQELLEANHEIASAVVSRQHVDLTDKAQKLEAETWSDKELGGEKKTVTELNIKRVMDRFAPETSTLGKEFRALMNEIPYGNDRRWVAFVNEIGKAMAEDKPLSIFGGGGGGGGKETKTLADALYTKT